MAESDPDSFILAQLAQQNFIDGEKITNLSLISAPIFKEIILQFFQKMGMDISEMRSNAVLQKFKIAGQILEILKKFNINCELTTLMNPTPADLRRILVVMLQKSNVKEEESQPQAKILTLDQKIKFVAEQQQQDILHKWLNEEWVLPQLSSKKQINYRSYETNIPNLRSVNMRTWLFSDCLQGLDKKQLLLLNTLSRKIQGLKIQRHLERDQYSEGDIDKYNIFLTNKMKDKRRIWKDAMKQREEKVQKNVESGGGFGGGGEFDEWSQEMVIDAGRRTLPRKIAQNTSQQKQVVVDQYEWEEYQREERGERIRMRRLLQEEEDQEKIQQNEQVTQNMFNLEINYGEEVYEEVEVGNVRVENAKRGKVEVENEQLVYGEGSQQYQDQQGEKYLKGKIEGEGDQFGYEEGGEEGEMLNKEEQIKRQQGQGLEDDNIENNNNIISEEKQLTEEQKKRANLQRMEQMQLELQRRREEMQKAIDERNEVEYKLKEVEQRMIERKKILQKKENEVKIEEARLNHLLDEQAQKQLNEANKRQEVEVAKMEREWQEHKQEVMGKLQEFKEQVSAKTEKYNKLKLKAKTIDEETQKLVNDIRNNEIVLKEVNEEYEQMPKTFSRGGFVERIKNISNNLSKQKNNFGMIANEIKDIKNGIAYSEQMIRNCFGDIENKFKIDAKKQDNLNKQIISMYQSYKDLYQKTKDMLEQKGRQKQLNRQIQMKIEELEMKNYQKNLERMQQDLAQIKAENDKLEKSSPTK